MKKLMIAAAVAGSLFATARASDGSVSSQNIVGYKTVSVTPNVQTINGASFVSVGSDELDIQDIKMNANLADGEAQIWWWNGSTYDAKAYWYVELYDEEENGLGYAGWGDFDYWMPVNKTFAPGESFWIKVNYGVDPENANYTMAGQVETVSASDQYYLLPLPVNQQVQITNPFPTGGLNIQDIKMSANLSDGEAQIWWWNGSTYDAKAYWYAELYDADENGLGYAGWGDFDYWMPVTKTFADGEGFWVKVNYGVAEENAYAKFPNPFYVAE